MNQSLRRRYRRYHVNGIRCASNLVIHNISLSGMAIETPYPLRVGKHYSLKLKGHSGWLSVWAEVVWSRRVEGSYRSGVDFSSSLGDAKELSSFIEEHIIIDLEDRLSGQFRAPKSADADAPGAFRVKRIGSFGMLVETRHPRPPLRGSLLEIELDEEDLPLECTARVTGILRPQEAMEDSARDIHLLFHDLSLDNSQALHHFIRGVLG